MSMISILQLNPQLKVKTPLGFGYCFFLIDYDLQINSVWIVRLDTDGSIKHFNSNQIFIDGNPTIDLPFLK